MIGYVCKYTPIEILAGLGEDVSFILPEESSYDYADSRMWPSVCSYAKSVLQHIHGGGYGSVVFTDCCDALKRVHDILAAGPHEPAVQSRSAYPFTIGLPRATGEDAVRVYAENIKVFIREYERYSGRSFDVGSFIGACEEHSSDNDCGKRSFKAERHGGVACDGPGGAGYVALMGARAPKSLISQAGELCTLPIRDMTCGSGERDFSDMPAEYIGRRDELILWYAGRLLSQMPCMRMNDNGARRGLYEDPQLKAVIYHTIQFCDFYGFEYAGLPRDIQGIKGMIKIETDYTPAASGQLKTRLQAFFESCGLLASGGEPDRKPSGESHEKSDINSDGESNEKTDDKSDEEPDGKTNGEPHEKSYGGGNGMSDSYSGGKYFAGVDCGSTSTNAVIVGGTGGIAASFTTPTGANGAEAAERALAGAIGKLPPNDDGTVCLQDDITQIIATGYGRASVPFAAKDVTEITCHARGAHELTPLARTIIDIGGQDSKVIRLDDSGGVAEFSMNDKCAAGTGRFLELMADTLGMKLDEMAVSGLNPNERIDISSMCAVFAESEVISLIAGGKNTEDIISGVNHAIAGRVASMAARLGAEPPYVMTGGVAKNAGVVKALGVKIAEQGGGEKIELAVPDDPQICGAFGAALIARGHI